MGDVSAATVASSPPLVVSSTARKDIEPTDPHHTFQHEAGRISSQSLARETHSQPHYNLRSINSSSPEDHNYAQNIHQQGPRTMPTDLTHFHGLLPEITDPSFSPSSTQTPFRYPSGIPPPIITHGYQSQNIPGITQSTNTVYYPFQNNRYPTAYYNPYAPQYAPQAISIAQMPVQHGPYFYAPGYPHSYPQTPTLVTGAPSNPPRSQPQLHPVSPRWPPGQQPVSHYVYMTNPCVTQATPQPMQQSFSHSLPNVQLPQQPHPPPNNRRHSHPVRNTFGRVRSSDSEPWQNSSWGVQGPRTNVQGGQGGSRAGNSNPTVNTRPPVSPSTQVNPTSSPQTDGVSSVQSETHPGSILTTVTPGAHPALPRGPPRKPKQSGHALWVGNLPPGTNVIDLKDHFSRGATKEIESVFLISKSNCAFINYKTDAACNEAMARFHDNKFKGVRLVCRLRRHSATSPAAVTISKEKSSNTQESLETQLQGDAQENTETITGVHADVINATSSEQLKDRIFILKSLTVEDLDSSVKNDVWATQTHNEEVLNRAFETCENVYLIFSANKSGEYYGYAKMTSRIPEKDVDENESRTNSDTSVGVHRIGAGGGGLPEALLPKAILTFATATAPEGQIIDDSARGTIFWEAMEDESVEGDNLDRPDLDSDELVSATKPWGKPFNVKWISTTKLPFHRTRGLRNGLNSNREVKIARDGTEVEYIVGKRLLQMFHQQASGSAPPVN